MNSKDLMLVIAGSVVFGGLAGAFGAHFVAPDPGGAWSNQDDLVGQIAKLERSLEETRLEMKQGDRAKAHLEERLTKAELRVAGLLEAEHTSPAGALRADGTYSATNASGDDLAALGEGTEALERRTRAVTQHLLESKIVALGDLKGQVEKFRFAAEFRALPEEERWTKLQEDLRLTDPQVHEIKDALAERDEGLKAARTDSTGDTETTISGGTVRFAMSHIDPEKMKQANEGFSTRVDNVLNEDQRKTWADKGYDQALNTRNRGMFISRSTTGSPGSEGGGTRISIGVIAPTPPAK